MANAKSSSLPSWKNPSGKTLLILLWALALALMALLSSWADMPWLSNGKLLIALGFTALVTALIGMAVVPMLVNLKASQVIQSDGPQSHLKKAGTPTMGGIFFVPVEIGRAHV